MRGIVFTELMEMVEQIYGYELVDELLQEVRPASKGSYTSVGNYPHQELVNLLIRLTGKVAKSVEELMTIYGQHLFQVFAKGYPVFFEDDLDAFTFLAGIENKIHPEVRKLYPDAELPRFNILNHDSKELIMDYSSERRMSSFALGLINGCFDHFNERATVKMDKLDESGARVRFTINRGA